MKKVLVLDDQKDVLELWHWHFKLWAEKVELFTGMNGADGMALMEKHKFDLIITDFKMPIVDGMDFISHVRRTDSETPIFLFSAYIPELGFLASPLQNVQFFEKPVIGGKLRTAINFCLFEKLVPIEAI